MISFIAWIVVGGELKLAMWQAITPWQCLENFFCKGQRVYVRFWRLCGLCHSSSKYAIVVWEQSQRVHIQADWGPGLFPDTCSRGEQWETGAWDDFTKEAAPLKYVLAGGNHCASRVSHTVTEIVCFLLAPGQPQDDLKN